MMFDSLIAQLRREAYSSSLDQQKGDPTFSAAQRRFMMHMSTHYQGMSAHDRALGGDPNWIEFDRRYHAWKDA